MIFNLFKTLLKQSKHRVRIQQTFSRTIFVFFSTICKFECNTTSDWLNRFSNFSFSHSVFYPFEELSSVFIKFEIVVCKLFQFGRV